MRAIFFDLDDTLLRFTRPYEELLADAFRDVHGEAEASWLETYDASFFDALEAMDPDPYRRAFRATGHDPDPLVDALWERELSACEPPAGAESDLRRLSEGHRLGVLTNGVTEWQRAKLAASGLDRFFDAVVVSYEVGAHKPDPAAFEVAEERLPADDYAMVGDSDADVDGADRAGWAAHRYDGGGFGDLPDALEW